MTQKLTPILLGILLSTTAQAQTSRQIVPGDVGIQVPFSTVGNLLAAGPNTSQIQDACSSGFCKMPSGLNFTNGINYGSGNADGPLYSWLYNQQSITGSPTNGIDGQISPLHFIIPDSVHASPNGVVGLAVKLEPVTGHTGFRTAIEGYISPFGAPGAPAVGYVGIQGYASTGSNLGGTTGSFNNYAGGMFGGNSNVFTASGATFLGLVTSWEFDTGLVTGSSAARKHQPAD